MSGHSKWSSIKRKKAITDSKRSAIFTKLIREITVAAKEGGPQMDSNPRLRLAVVTARKANMPKDVIDRAVNKGSGSDATNYQEVVYEGYGPNGVAIMVETLTDNGNRTVANLRTLFGRSGGALGTSGSVGYMFARKGEFTVPVKAIEDEALTLAMLDAGADDIENDGEWYSISCPFEQFGAVSSALDKLKLDVESSELNRIPATTVSLEGDALAAVLKLIDNLENDDDVQKVFHNLEFTEEAMAQLS